MLKKRLKAEGSEAVTKCNALALPTSGGPQNTDCAAAETLCRIIEAVPSKRAEPIKRYLAMAGAERILDTAQPSRLVERAIDNYRKKARDDEWIDGRLQNISARNELTDEWSRRGAEGAKAAPITAAISEEMLGVTPSDHRDMKGHGKRVELRDHMDNLELAVTTLGERAAKAIIVARDTKDFQATKDASLTGAKVAGDAARKIEQELGRTIANTSNFLPKSDEAKGLAAPAAPKIKRASRKK